MKCKLAKLGIFEKLAIIERFFQIFHQFIGSIAKLRLHLLRRGNFYFYHVTYGW